ncbi:DUF1254 domain-containing protein [Sphingomonas sp. SM33]|uniref:DUF1254 domain-containing protein n=1 Tax=Sphingomonas telluris TaxID=2907998 RepID=A0ABS9VQ95_9SPHN|nr:DUF1254 domain-containing protein [Sphingomonas telluris]MCH8617161.1 DUF1254 domain-containing protein [Sphingomonas telluris]
MSDMTVDLIREPETGSVAGEINFKLGYPDAQSAQRAYDDTDLNRAITAYRFFYPTVSGAAIVQGDLDCGLVPNKVFGVMHSGPEQVLYTTNNDTPYGPLLLDLGIGPLVIELQPGPLIVCSIDVNQRWVADMGLPGPDAGKGGKHILVPPGFKGELPSGNGIYVHEASSNLQIVGARALPVGGDVEGAKTRLTTIKVYPLDSKTEWSEPQWKDLTGVEQQGTPLAYERDFKFWEVLHKTVDHEPAYEGYHNEYGELAALGIEKGKPFAPDARMKDILTRAAAIANDEMRVQSFADRRPDRFPWPGRKWEWASLRYEDGDFNTALYTDLEAREKWFYQAIGASPAMFRRDAQAGSLYWLGLRDTTGAYLDGGRNYRLTVPLPVPGHLFWSVTVYETDTRSQIRTDQNKAALRSMFELKDLSGGSAELFFGPETPAGKEGRWIKTTPGKGWFVYFRIYGPQAAAFDGSWKPGDFERVG